MSTLIVEVSVIKKVEAHPNADRLAIATVKGWKTCITFDPKTQKAQFSPGDPCIYIPPDSVVPLALAERFGVIKYCQPVRDSLADPPVRFRVKAARLRGIPSYGLVIPPDNPAWAIGENVTNFYGITKWDPPDERFDGDAAPSHPAFHHYTEIETWQNFPDAFEEGEEVVVTEKIHGKNCRLGYIHNEKNGVWNFMCGSHNLPRKEFDARGAMSDFWKPCTEEVKRLLRFVSGEKRNVIVFGEIFGDQVQDTAYGKRRGEIGFRLFDIAVDGCYLDWNKKIKIAEQFGVPTVPIYYRGPYSMAIVERFTHGETTVCDPENAGAFKWREGVVITPSKERFSDQLNGRVILKSVSADFLARKGAKDGH